MAGDELGALNQYLGIQKIVAKLTVSPRFSEGKDQNSAAGKPGNDQKEINLSGIRDEIIAEDEQEIAGCGNRSQPPEIPTTAQRPSSASWYHPLG